MRKKKERRLLRLLCVAAALLVLTAAGAQFTAKTGPTPYYETQLEAARRLEDCFAAVRGYREELGIPMSEDDLHRTGMIGLPYTGITTTQGALEAKRTTDMAALCVRMLYEAGVRPGDTVGAGFSGSFPGMDLAVVTACESMGVELVCIASVGASTYGANLPELTFPEMLDRLERDGLISTKSAAVTMGGYHDVGEDMDPQLAEDVRLRLREAGLNLVEEPDFAANIAWREELYRAAGPIDCFVAVGGNVTSLGRGEGGVSLGQGVLHPAGAVRVNEDSGLVQRYLAQDLPVVNLLNIKKLMADYGMPFDPAVWPPEGTSSAYTTLQYDRRWLAVGLGGTAAVLAVCLWVQRHPQAGKKERRAHHG